ncbi:MAG: FliM/FliN family flagellar motor switch protein [Gammaproteobacteria bacterium]|nr:flagellar motor switch protein FliN [Gammaproteobacteria bacterium]
MNTSEAQHQDDLPNELPDEFDEAEETPPPRSRPRRDFTQMMRKIPVTLTLEVGSARISLQELATIEPNSVIELDTLAGEPLIIKVNGTPIGRAEVVVSGEKYGLRVLELSDLELGSLT